MSTDDITKIMIDFGDDYEAFNPKISSQDIKFSEDNLTISKSIWSGRSAYGTIDAISGGKYHWKLKLIDDCPVGNGAKTDCNGISFNAGDIVEMYLDLKDENTFKYMLNGQDVGTIPCDCKKNVIYKLAFGFHTTGKVALISFDEE